MWGAVATLVMTAFMLAATATGIAPMPNPIPLALVNHTLGSFAQPWLTLTAMLTHLGYGAAAGALLASTLRHVKLSVGLIYGALLWVVMGAAWLPYLGWGVFGTAIDPRIAIATLVLHLIYGLTLCSLLDRDGTPIARRMHPKEA